MEIPRKADPSAYNGLRDLVFRMKLQRPEDDGVQLVLMDWNIGKGVASVLASSDGTASVYLSSGGGYIGGGQRYPTIRETAIRATEIATRLSPLARLTETFEIPSDEREVFFYLRSRTGVYRAIAKVTELGNRTDPFTDLGNLMQQIITLYRQTTPPQAEPAQNG
jgi:hypothetical protein